MKKLISEKIAVIVVMVILSLVILFHLLIITGVIPFVIVWGGRLKTTQQMLAFEAASIAVNLIMLFVVTVRSRLWRINLNRRLITLSLWTMTILFILNTIGNLLSENQLEKIIFTLLTFVLALLCLRLATVTGKDLVTQPTT